MAYKILVIEDDKWLSELYVDALSSQAETEVIVADSAESALDVVDEHADISLITLDMFLPEHNGIEFLHEIASHPTASATPIVVLSSVYRHDFNLSEDRWRHYGVVEYLYKPHTKPEQLVATIKKQLVADAP